MNGLFMVEIWILNHRNNKCAGELKGHTDNVNTIIQIKNSFLVSGSRDGTELLECGTWIITISPV